MGCPCGRKTKKKKKTEVNLGVGERKCLWIDIVQSTREWFTLSTSFIFCVVQC